jgi:hypothetical protein
MENAALDRIINLDAVPRSVRMDPVSLATSAAALLAPYLLDRGIGKVADEVTEAAVAKVRELYRWLRGALAGRPADRALDRLERDPGNDGYLVAFQVELADLVESKSGSDQAFVATLERLVEEAQRAAGVSFSQVHDTGAVAGRDVHLRGGYVAGRDMIIGTPRSTDGGE